MSDDTKSGLDAVDEGPVPSDAASPTERSAGADPQSHPTVAALFGKFGDAVWGHRIAAGDEHVIFADAARNIEILGFLRDDADQRYDLLRDVTAAMPQPLTEPNVMGDLWSPDASGPSR